MNDFRILNENTFSFKEGKLYLMLLRENGRFGIEVVNRAKTFGRKFAKEKKDADFLFEVISDKLNQCKQLALAEDLVKKCFKKQNPFEISFLFLVDNKLLTQEEIGQLIIDFKLKVQTKYDRLCEKKKKGSITTYVFFPLNKKPIGRFFGTRFGNDLKFELL